MSTPSEWPCIECTSSAGAVLQETFACSCILTMVTSKNGLDDDDRRAGNVGLPTSCCFLHLLPCFVEPSSLHSKFSEYVAD